MRADEVMGRSASPQLGSDIYSQQGARLVSLVGGDEIGLLGFTLFPLAFSSMPFGAAFSSLISLLRFLYRGDYHKWYRHYDIEDGDYTRYEIMPIYGIYFAQRTVSMVKSIYFVSYQFLDSS